MLYHKEFYHKMKLNLAPLGYLAGRGPLGGGADSDPLPNSQTLGRSEVGEAANESSR